MKLQYILFESVSTNDVIEQMAIPATSNGSETSKIFDNIAYEYEEFDGDIYNVFDAFIDLNHSAIQSILKLATKFEYLGSGTYGDAYDLGNYVLKIETKHIMQQNANSEERGKKTTKALWSGNKKGMGKAVPMIYDSGEFHFLEHAFYWEIKEKFETPDLNDVKLKKALSDTIALLQMKNGIRYLDTSDVSYIADKLRLGKDWVKRLASDMAKLKKQGMNDFHTGNIGIRRSGAEGYLYFFD